MIGRGVESLWTGQHEWGASGLVIGRGVESLWMWSADMVCMESFQTELNSYYTGVLENSKLANRGCVIVIGLYGL